MKLFFNFDLLFSFVCECVQMHVLAHECGSRRSALGVIPQAPSTHFLLFSLSQDLDSLFRRGWPACVLQGPISTSPTLGF